MTDKQEKKLNKFIKKINAPIFENTCYFQCVNIIRQYEDLSEMRKKINYGIPWRAR